MLSYCENCGQKGVLHGKCTICGFGEIKMVDEKTEKTEELKEPLDVEATDDPNDESNEDDDGGTDVEDEGDSSK